MNECHLQFFGPLKNEYVDWPATAVSVYRISGDDIARRIVRDDSGKVVERHSWCGYIGSFNDMADASAAIEKDRSK